eukprot:EG_transcript_1137
MTVVWDLKSKRQAMSFQDTQNRLRCSAIAWSPDKATDICVAIDDDANPVIQFWDLRKAYSPVRALAQHRQGVLSLSWSPMDSNLLVSCGKDCRTICWNPNTAEVLCELPTSNNWVFDVQWSLRIPAILATGSFGEKIMVYSLQDSSPTEPVVESSEFAIGSPLTGKTIKTAPKWLRRPAGATFGFGSRLVSFGQPPEGSKEFKFALRTVTTEQELVDRAKRFEEVLKGDQLPTYCTEKVHHSSDAEQTTWSVLKTLLEEAPRKKLLEYLGFDAARIQQEIEERLNPVVEDPFSEDAEENAEQLAVIPPEELEGLIQRAITVGNFEAAVKCCLHAGRMDDALVLASYGGQALWKRTQEAYFQRKAGNPFMKTVASILDNRLGSIVQDVDAASDQWKQVLAVMCTYCKPEELSGLAGSLGEKLASKGNPASILAYLAAGNLDLAVDAWVSQLDTLDAKKSQDGLQDFIEKVSVFQRITEKPVVSSKIAAKYTEYAELLSSQGCLDGAKRYLELLKPDCHVKGAALRDRVYRCHAGAGFPPFPPPPFPFTREDIHLPERAEEPEAPSVPSAPPTPKPQAAPFPPVPSAAPQAPPEPAPVQPAPEVPQPVPQPFGQPAAPAQPQPVAPQPAPAQPQYAPAQPAPQPFQQPYPGQPQPAAYPATQPAAPQFPGREPTPAQPQPAQPQYPSYPSQPQPQPVQPQQHTFPAYGQPQPQPFGQPGWQAAPPQPAAPAPPQPAAPAPAQPQPPSFPAAAAPSFPAHPPTPPVPAALTTPTSGGAAAGGALAGLAAAVPAQWQPLATNLNTAFSRLGTLNPADQKKRPAVEKALTSFYQKLAANECSPDVCQLMLQFARVCETDSHEAKEVVRKLTDAHWDQFKAFKDVKFLSK